MGRLNLIYTEVKVKKFNNTKTLGRFISNKKKCYKTLDLFTDVDGVRHKIPMDNPNILKIGEGE